MRELMKMALAATPAVILVAGPAWAGPICPRWTFWGAAGGGWFGFILTILLWVVIVGGAVALARWLVLNAGVSKRSSGDPAKDAALEILRNRYASGEIDGEEFEQRRRALTSA